MTPSNNKSRKSLALQQAPCATLIFLAGCSLHTIETSPTPTIDLQTTYKTSLRQEQSASSWTVVLDEPILTSLVKHALGANLTIRQALKRIGQARAMRNYSQAGGWPVVELGSNTAQEWENLSLTTGDLAVFAQISWEADLFGRFKSEKTAREFELEASKEDLFAAILSLEAEIASTYYSAVAERKILELLDRQIQVATDFLEITKLRFKGGIAANVDVLQQQSQLAEIKSLLPRAQSALRLLENHLDLLVGEIPDGKDRISSTILPHSQISIPTLAAPADLLLSRPDLASLRNQVVAADARLGEAISDRLPKLNLGTLIGITDDGSGSLPGLSVIASITHTIVDFGKSEQTVLNADAVREETLARFTLGYLQALEEVENSLFEIQTQEKLLATLEERKTILTKTLDETRARYEQGLTDYLPVLTALGQLQEVEREGVREELKLIQIKIVLTKALGVRLTR